MPKYERLINFSSQKSSLDEIAAYFNDTDTALRFFYTTRAAKKFREYRPEKIEEELDDRIAELDATCCMSLLADLEATFRMDYQQRCREKRKDPLSRAFRAIHKRKGPSASLRQDIFESWRAEYPNLKNLFSIIDGAFNYRNWLAHGRYWKPALGRKYDFLVVFQIGLEARQTIPFVLK